MREKDRYTGWESKVKPYIPMKIEANSEVIRDLFQRPSLGDWEAANKRLRRLEEEAVEYQNQILALQAELEEVTAERDGLSAKLNSLYERPL